MDASWSRKSVAGGICQVRTGRGAERDARFRDFTSDYGGRNAQETHTWAMEMHSDSEAAIHISNMYGLLFGESLKVLWLLTFVFSFLNHLSPIVGDRTTHLKKYAHRSWIFPQVPGWKFPWYVWHPWIPMNDESLLYVCCSSLTTYNHHCLIFVTPGSFKQCE